MVTTLRPVPVPDLQTARREFDRWRSTRRRGARIPESLWQLALDMASAHGVSKAAQALQLDYYGVKRRLGAAGARASTAATTEFVALSLPATTGGARCQVELEDDFGARLRVEVSGLPAMQLATFVRVMAGRDSCCK